MFQGSMVALVTPMNKQGEVDHKALCDLLEWHIAEKTDAIVATGTTGESATLEPDEHFAVINTLAKQAKKRIPIIAGTGTNATKSTLKLSENAKLAGADACLIVTPYYNKPTQAGLFAHFKTIAQETTLPIILYNVPHRTACDLLPDTIEKLAALSSIIGIKEATGDLERGKLLIEKLSPTFKIYSGDDASALSLIKLGAEGVISVTANIAPHKMHLMCKAARQKNFGAAESYNQELMLLHQDLFIESNPIPTKWALHYLKKISLGIRLPLLPLDVKHHDKVKTAMQQAGVIL